jgi:hypothetical protein
MTINWKAVAGGAGAGTLVGGPVGAAVGGIAAYLATRNPTVPVRVPATVAAAAAAAGVPIATVIAAAVAAAPPSPSLPPILNQDGSGMASGFVTVPVPASVLASADAAGMVFNPDQNGMTSAQAAAGAMPAGTPVLVGLTMGPGVASQLAASQIARPAIALSAYSELNRYRQAVARRRR